MRSLVLLLLCVACTPRPSSSVSASGAPVADPAVVYEELEDKIGVGRDTEQQRVDALATVERAADDGSAEYAFVRAALNGRVAELRGANAGRLVTEAESWARKSLDRDPTHRSGAARQLLGSLYVMAPARLLEHGDSEIGLAMLESLVASAPTQVRFRLRLAQAYMHLGEDEPALPQLCACLADPSSLRGDERKLLARLVADVESREPLACAKP